MPELPDVNAYLCALETRIVGRTLGRIRVASPFVLRTAQPPIADAEGRMVRELSRIGKRVVIGLSNDLWIVIHLMIAGRLHWRTSGAKLSGRNSLAAFDFADGFPVLTEAGTKRRASLREHPFYPPVRRSGLVLGGRSVLYRVLVIRHAETG
jgi:formamidopyrimidine-DNA glycosylase